MTKLEIINETVEFYAVDPKRRAVMLRDNAIPLCFYLTDEGQSCAVGRCMINPPRMNEFMGTVLALTHQQQNLGETLDDLLKPEYHGHDHDFWSDLQRFHDWPEYWEDDGLSDAGLAYIEQLRTKYADVNPT